MPRGEHLKGDGWKRMQQKHRGRQRAAFWRALGFPNLVRARAATIAKRASGEGYWDRVRLLRELGIDRERGRYLASKKHIVLMRAALLEMLESETDAGRLELIRKGLEIAKPQV